MIPNTFHFVHLSLGNGRDFALHHYLCIKSCHEVNKPDKITVYCDIEPTGEWWSRARKYVDVVYVEPPDTIFGKKVTHPAHKSDIIRLQALIEYGGVYCDTDTIFIKPYNEFYKYTTVLGEQGKNGNEGICPAVIMSEKGSQFISEWLLGFKDTFVGTDPGTQGWCTHSVYLPAVMLQRKNYHGLKVAISDYFFNPTYHQPDLKNLFENDIDYPSAYSFHLWETQSKQWLSALDETRIKSEVTTYNKIASKYL